MTRLKTTSTTSGMKTQIKRKGHSLTASDPKMCTKT